MSFIGSLIRAFVERRAAKASIDELRKGLETSCSAVALEMANAADTPMNRQKAAHVIGIERWGQQRLRAALTPARAPVMDEYDGYRPSLEQPMSDRATLHTPHQRI